VIDSGIARTRELAPLLVAERDLGQVSPREAFHPRFDHGTMVATILARGLDSHVRIVSLRIDDPAGCPAGRVPPCQPSAEPIAAAIRTATAMHVDAINISMRLAEAPAIVAAVHEATQQGILVIMAAGNEGEARPGNLAMARAGFPNAVLVGALDAGGQPWSGTNRPVPGATDYAYSWERGVDVPTVLADGHATTATGTSFAAPLETARRLSSRAKRQPASLASATLAR
jgi:subtilisin family serine protease